MLFFLLIGGILGRLCATGKTVEVGARKKRVGQGESRRGLPVAVHVLLTHRGPVPISRLPLIGRLDAADVDAGIRPGHRYRMQLASWPWLGQGMVIEIYP